MTFDQGRVVDLRADLHGHVLDFVTSEDRRWFAAHPEATWYVRPPVEHELCIPDSPCFDLLGSRILVLRLADGSRARTAVA